MSDLKLQIELVPSTSVGMNLHSSLVLLYGEKKWVDLAKEIIDNAGQKCEICGAESNYDLICGECTPQDEKCYNCLIDTQNCDPFLNYHKQKVYFGLECHEKWSYDIATHVQKLDGFIALCKLCHQVKHINRAENLERKGYVFNWDNIPGNDDGRLINFLRKNYDIDWINNYKKFEKIHDGNTIILSTILSTVKNCLYLKLNDEKTNVRLEIDDISTNEFIAKMKNGKLKIYRKDTLDMKTVTDHFMKVNKCDINRYNQHRADAEEKYEMRSKDMWDIYFGEYAAPILKYSILQEFLHRGRYVR